jgi:HK97 family phage major capsid protein
MTTPAPARIVTSSFGGVLTPAQVNQLLNALIEGAPFAASLTRATTATGKLAFPTVAPSGYAWLEELQQVPRLVLNDKALIVAVAKIIGALPVSAEMYADSAVNITSWVSDALRDSLSRDLDLGLLNGTGTPQPDGITDQADPVSGATLIAAAGAAIAAIGEAGGQADTIALSPTAYAAELTATDADGRLVHPDGLPDLFGLRIVQVPALDPPLLYDARRVFLVLGQDSTVTLHDDWEHDATMLLVKARANAGVPVAHKSIRKLEIGDDAARTAASRASSTGAKAKAS